MNRYRDLKTGDWVIHQKSKIKYLVIRCEKYSDGTSNVFIMADWGIFPQRRSVLRAIPRKQCNWMGFYPQNLRAIIDYYSYILGEG